MRKRKLLTLIPILTISLAMLAAIGMLTVSAQPRTPVPEIVVTPTIQTGTTGGFIQYTFNIKNAPHIDYDGDSAYWDQEATWGWQIELNWDPTVLDCPSAGYISEDATYSFLGFWDYYEAIPFPPFYQVFPYPRSGLTISLDAAAGRVVLFDGLQAAPDVTTMPIHGSDPYAGLHLGTNYDLPYTEGLTVWSGHPGELNLFSIYFGIVQDGPPYATPLTINTDNTYFWAHDATTTYHVSTPTAWFGVTGPHLHNVGSFVDRTDPVPSSWHELYPNYCNEYDLVYWEDDPDNPDGLLSASDTITLDPTSPAGDPATYHVDSVTTTLYLEKKPLPSGEFAYIDYLGDYNEHITEPLDTQWHEMWPEYCRWYHLSDWEDTGPGNEGELGPSDQILLTDKETGIAEWWHIADMSTDITVTPQPGIPPVPEFPLGITLIMIMAPLIPTVYLLRIRRKVTK